MNFSGIDHLVITVEDIEATCAFYERIGGDVVTFGDDRTAVRFGDRKINVHHVDDEFDPVASEPTPGSEDFCLVVDGPIEAVERRLDTRDVEIVTGPVERTGAVGPLTSVYVRDPDGNLVEIATYETDTRTDGG